MKQGLFHLRALGRVLSLHPDHGPLPLEQDETYPASTKPAHSSSLKNSCYALSLQGASRGNERRRSMSPGRHFAVSCARARCTLQFSFFTPRFS